MKVIVVGMIYSNNLGDGVIFHSLKLALEELGAKVDSLDTSGMKGFQSIESNKNNKGLKSKLINISPTLYKSLTIVTSMIGRKKFNKFAEEKIKNADMVIIGGGQLITNFTETLPTRLLDIAELCNRNSKPYSIYGCGVGNSFTKLGKSKYTKLLNGASYVSVRGLDSKARLEKYCNIKGVKLVPDPVFGLNSTKSLKESRIFVGICYQDIMSMAMHERKFLDIGKCGVEEIVFNIVNQYKQLGIRCAIFTNGDPVDFSYANEFYNKYKNVVDFELAERPTTPVELIDLISNFSHVISFRMHGAIIAHALGKPTLNIVWDKKINEVWGTVNNESVPVAVDDFIEKKTMLKLAKSLISKRDVSEIYNDSSRDNLKFCLESMERNSVIVS
ncbi:TPA: polysaccharide pyruvyl transferase family protein [Vibrio parahaemolyticus]|nr:polysaccharide pyruvyl transferase family protein [Vibrio parahaemolyticus]